MLSYDGILEFPHHFYGLYVEQILQKIPFFYGKRLWYFSYTEENDKNNG